MRSFLVIHIHFAAKYKPEGVQVLPVEKTGDGTYRPDYFLSGHSHEFPYFLGHSWAQIVQVVNVLVPGQLLSAPFPNHIILNTVSKEEGWETSSREWILEDGLYDHLVVKFPRE